MTAATADRSTAVRVRLLRALGHGVARLPQPALLALGRVLAIATRPLQRRRARIAATNLALCFPQLEPRLRRRLLADTLQSATTGLLECLRAWYAPATTGLFRVEGLEHVQAARRQGRGVVLLLAHYTMVELAVRMARDALGQPVTMMKRPHNDRRIEAEIDRCRRRHCGATLDKDDARGLLSALASGAVVAYAADQDFNFHHVFVPFFGVPAATTTAPATLARRSGAPVIPCWTRREADGRYTVRFGAPWPGWPAGDKRADAARYMAAIEAEVRTAPEQYLWVHRRFKTRPPGEPSVYR